MKEPENKKLAVSTSKCVYLREQSMNTKEVHLAKLGTIFTTFLLSPS